MFLYWYREVCFPSVFFEVILGQYDAFGLFSEVMVLTPGIIQSPHILQIRQKGKITLVIQTLWSWNKCLSFNLEISRKNQYTPKPQPKKSTTFFKIFDLEIRCAGEMLWLAKDQLTESSCWSWCLPKCLCAESAICEHLTPNFGTSGRSFLRVQSKRAHKQA